MKETLTTLCRIGEYGHLLEESIGKSSEKLKATIAPCSKIKTYATFTGGTDPYLLIVSQRMDFSGPNTYIAVMSKSDKTNLEVVDRFKAETGINLPDDRKDLGQIIASLGRLFPEFEREPENAISRLEGKI